MKYNLKYSDALPGWMAEAISTKYGLEISKEEALEKLWVLSGKTWLSW